ncbi:MAG: Rne/Rng family ribonuclease [Phycisphaerae bacterium]|jgi:ribonuclease E|nr:Rne/Rng family ribonuclease [Phycisphaerae bacterium]
MARQMLINSLTGQECRIVILNDSIMEELYVERASSASRVGNIYKGRVTNIEPSIQAAFIDFGLYKNGFLHISDLTSEYFPKGKGSGAEGVGRKHPHRDRPPIQECLKRGQEVVVQMTKEGIGTKGPTMTTYLSIPGRLLVMMPGMKRLGVSRKVEDEDIRARAKDALSQLNLPADMGFIVRTAGVDSPKREMNRDLNYLLRLWKSTSELIKTAKAPIEIYRESDLVIRTLRDAYSTDIDRIVCDNPGVSIKVRDFLKIATPRTKTRIEVYTGSAGLFHDMGLDEEIEKINSRRVELPSGGSLVIDPTEALVAIDVNSGRSRGHNDAEATALNTNMEAARAIGRQLRMRDLGGVIVMDFIDMRNEKNRRAVEKELKDVMKGDRAKNRVLRINSFGILQMTRQRLGPSLKHSYYSDCPHCDGLGMVKSEESQALVVMRLLSRASANDSVSEINIICPPQVAHYLTNYQRRDIILIEETTKKNIIITADNDMTGDDVRIECLNARGSKVAGESGKHKRSKLKTVALDAFLSKQPTKSAPVESAEDQPDGKEAAKPKKTRRRGRSGSAKKTTTAKDGAKTKTNKPEEKTADKPNKTRKTGRKKTGRKKTEKSEEAAEKKSDKKSSKTQSAENTDASPKAAKSKNRRRRTNSKQTTVKASQSKSSKDSIEESPKKTSKRAKKSKSAKRRPPRSKPAAKEISSNEELSSVIPPSKLREEFEAKRLEEQKGKPPQKTLLEAMGFDDDSDK